MLKILMFNGCFECLKTISKMHLESGRKKKKKTWMAQCQCHVSV